MSEKILICVPVWNRKDITELVLTQLNNHKGDGNEVWVYNDYSTEYDNDWLSTMCDKVVQLPESSKTVIKNETNKKGMGVQHIRWQQFRDFVNQDEFDYIYMTDNDAFHDPDYINQLLTLHKKYKTKNGMKLPVCLYNTIYHSQPQNTRFENEDVFLRITAPGVSMLYSKDMVKKIVEVLDMQKEDPIYAWDYRAQEWLRLPWITTKSSFVEHYGASKESMHTPEGMWDRDRAVNPTKYLQDNRDSIISYLEGKIEKPNL